MHMVAQWYIEHLPSTVQRENLASIKFGENGKKAMNYINIGKT